MNSLYIDIGNRIAKLRHENRLTQAQLAEKLDISVKHMSESERGLTCLSMEKLVLLCEILSTDMDYLIRGIDHREKAEADIPNYIVELFRSDDDSQKQLLQEYFLLFKKIRENK